MTLTPIQKKAVIWILPCVLVGAAAALYTVYEALYMQSLIDGFRTNEKISDADLSPHQYGAWVLLYLVPPLIAVALFIFPFACIRGWYGRKKGPGVGHFDATLVHAKNDLLKSIRGNKDQKEAEKEAKDLHARTSEVKGVSSPSRRL